MESKIRHFRVRVLTIYLMIGQWLVSFLNSLFLSPHQSSYPPLLKFFPNRHHAHQSRLPHSVSFLQRSLGYGYSTSPFVLTPNVFFCCLSSKTSYHTMKIVWICSTILYLCNPTNKLAYLYDVSPVEQIRESRSRKRWHYSSGHCHTRNVTLSSSEAFSLITVRIFVRNGGIHL